MAAPPQQYHPKSLDVFNSQCLFLSVSGDFEEFLSVADEYVVSVHSEPCTKSGCRFHLIIKGEKLIEKLSKMSFWYQKVDSLFYYYKFLVKFPFRLRGSTMHRLQDAINLAEIHPRIMYQPSVHKKRLARKKMKRHQWNGKTLRKNVKNVGVQCSLTLQNDEKNKLSPSLQMRISKILNSNFAFDFMQIVDCFNDNFGSISSKHLKFQLNYF